MKILFYILLISMIPCFAFGATFGTTSSAGLSASGAVNTLVATKYTLSELGIVTSISVYTTAGHSGNIKVGIYADNAGSPGDLLVSTTAGSAVSSASWATIDITPTELSSGVYWIATIDDSASLRGNKNGGTNQACYKTGGTYAAGLPSFFTPTGYQNKDYVCYGTYVYPELNAQGNYIDIHNGAGSLSQPYVLDLVGNIINIYNGNATIYLYTDSTELIADTPDGDEVDGYWTGTLALQGNYLDIYNGNQTTLTKNNQLQGIGNYLSIYNGTITELTRITDSTVLIESTPNGDAVNGSWIESIYGIGNYLDIYNSDTLTLVETWFIAQAGIVPIVNGNLGSVKWQSGITYAPGAEWYNDKLVYISGGSLDESADMITFGGF